jgi:pilus assembly protein Flp/PilA
MKLISVLVSEKSIRKEKRNMLSATQKGQGLVEYALIIVLVSIVVIAALTILGPRISNVFNRISGTLSTV